MLKREEEKSKRAETKAGQMLSTKEPEGYAECYPGMSEMADAIDDSDDEVEERIRLASQNASAEAQSAQEALADMGYFGDPADGAKPPGRRAKAASKP